ncbi:ABC transporter substrate-binding protein [Paenibacillus antarcticus]|nr:ABC transporter substrate-binding protein [Paenibacillus antarcticus]
MSIEREPNMKRYGFLVLTILWIILLMACSDGDKNNTGPIGIGAILPLTGELSSKGEARETALHLAMDEIDTYLDKANLGFNMQLTVKDSKSDPEETLKQAKALHEEGTDILIVGSSAELTLLKSWSDSNDVVVISYSSTAPSLAVDKDSIYRVVPNDYQQAKALATLLSEQGIRKIIPVQRNDVYGRELSQQLIMEFKELGGKAASPVIYEPGSTDFKSTVSQMEQQLENSDIDPDSVGIVLFSFDEVIPLLEQADALNHVRWFGTDTTVLNSALINNVEAATFAATVNFMGVTFGINDTPLFQEVQKKLQEKLKTQVIPDAIFAYDIPWMLVTAFENMDNPDDAVELKANLVELSAKYAGATGWMLLDYKGDRKYSLYDIWQVKENSSKVSWIKTAQYRRDPGLSGFITSVQN